jgi:hypothetical protein
MLAFTITQVTTVSEEALYLMNGSRKTFYIVVLTKFYLP